MPYSAKTMKKLLVLLLVVGANIEVAKAESRPMKQIKTYMAFTYPLDPARIFSIADMDISYALASTLVQWDQQKQVASAVASEWKKQSEKTFRFTIRSGLKWSDGSAVTAEQVKSSILRALSKYPEDLRAVKKQVSKIVAVDANHLDFELNVSTSDSNLLGKLTEPQYGVLRLNNNDEIDFSKTTGAFYVAKESKDEIILKKNPYWISSAEPLADEVIIRKPKNDYDHQKVLLTDSWPNLAQTFSLIPADLINQYKKDHYSIWTRPVDKVYLLSASKSLAKNNLLGLLRYLDQKLNRAAVVGDLSVSPATQLFPYGYQLHDKEYVSTVQPVSLPEEFKNRPIQILCPGANINSKHFQRIKSELKAVIGIEPEFQIVSLEESGARRVKGDFDIYMGSMGLADPDPEGLMSYYLEGDAPVIPPGKDNFVSRLDHARSEKDEKKQIEMMRKILTDAKNKGYILPLFHIATVGLARNEIDLSKVPNTDESITLSKVRFKK